MIIEWYAYPIMIMGTMLFFLMLAFFLARHQIKLRLQTFMKRKTPSLLYTEMRNDKKICQGVASVLDGQMKIGKNKEYSIDDSHVFLMPEYGITGVIVSEKTASSIDPQGQSNLSPQLIDGVIKRVKATALGDSMKIIKIGYLIMGFLGAVVLCQCFILFKFYSAMQSAGISINF